MEPIGVNGLARIRRGMKVWVGLAHDPGFRLEIRRDPILVEVYLRRLRLRSEAVAAELAPLARRHRSFAGWHVPEEIDDGSRRAPELRPLLFDPLRDLTRNLRATAPGCEVAISGFSNARSDPRAFQKFRKSVSRSFRPAVAAPSARARTQVPAPVSPDPCKFIDSKGFPCLPYLKTGL